MEDSIWLLVAFTLICALVYDSSYSNNSKKTRKRSHRKKIPIINTITSPPIHYSYVDPEVTPLRHDSDIKYNHDLDLEYDPEYDLEYKLEKKQSTNTPSQHQTLTMTETEGYPHKGVFIKGVNSDLFDGKLLYYLLKTNEQKSPDQNNKNNKSCIYSSLSLMQALSFLYLGASKITLKILRQIFNCSPKALIQYYSKLNRELISTKSIKIANSFWIDKKQIKIKPMYLKQASLLGTIKNIDFSDSNINQHLSQWIAEKTNNMIDSLEIDGNSNVFLVNTIYFNAKWKYQFDPEDTVPDKFHITNYSSVNVLMMEQKGNYSYYGDDKIKMIKLDYHGPFSMIIVLDHEHNYHPFVLKTLINCLQKMKEQEVNVKIPRFTIETELDLTNPLKKVGLTEIFGESYQDIVLDGNLKIDAIIQKCKIEVDEQGTKASVVSVAISKGKSLTKDDELWFIANKPFMYYLIYDSPTEENIKILFSGYYKGP